MGTDGLVYVEGIGYATTCSGYTSPHRPRPMRYVHHHLLPQVCGGKTTAANTRQLCDSCHYSTHALLWLLALHGGDTHVVAHIGTPQQRSYAETGYRAAVAAGTVALIPNEGGASAG